MAIEILSNEINLPVISGGVGGGTSSQGGGPPAYQPPAPTPASMPKPSLVSEESAAQFTEGLGKFFTSLLGFVGTPTPGGGILSNIPSVEPLLSGVGKSMSTFWSEYSNFNQGTPSYYTSQGPSDFNLMALKTDPSSQPGVYSTAQSEWWKAFDAASGEMLPEGFQQYKADVFQSSISAQQKNATIDRLMSQPPALTTTNPSPGTFYGAGGYQWLPDAWNSQINLPISQGPASVSPLAQPDLLAFMQGGGVGVGGYSGGFGGGGGGGLGGGGGGVSGPRRWNWGAVLWRI